MNNPYPRSKQGKFWFYGKCMILLADALFQESGSAFALFLIWKLHSLIFDQEFPAPEFHLTDEPFIGSAEFVFDAYVSKLNGSTSSFDNDELWSWLFEVNETYTKEDFASKNLDKISDFPVLDKSRVKEYYLKRGEVIVALTIEMQKIGVSSGFDVLKNFWNAMLSCDKIDLRSDDIYSFVDQCISVAIDQKDLPCVLGDDKRIHDFAKPYQELKLSFQEDSRERSVSPIS